MKTMNVPMKFKCPYCGKQVEELKQELTDLKEDMEQSKKMCNFYMLEYRKQKQELTKLREDDEDMPEGAEKKAEEPKEDDVPF